MEYSPILAVATAAFEIIVAGWALTTKTEHGSRNVLRTTGAILALLAAYQIAEVAICANVEAAGFLPRMAFVIVTWLPPLGVLLVAQLRRPRSSALYGSAYAMLAAAAAIVGWIVLDRSFASASVCNAVYTRYTHAMPRFSVYAWFYWAGLVAMAVGSGIGAATSVDPIQRGQSRLVLVGTLAFVVPGVAVSWLVPPARGALPSILCHFAMLLAICLARVVHLERRLAEASGRTVSHAH